MISGSTTSSASTGERLLGANIKLETDSHCFLVREINLGTDVFGTTDGMILFAEKYHAHVKLTRSDLKLLRFVICNFNCEQRQQCLVVAGRLNRTLEPVDI